MFWRTRWAHAPFGLDGRPRGWSVRCRSEPGDAGEWNHQSWKKPKPEKLKQTGLAVQARLVKVSTA